MSPKDGKWRSFPKVPNLLQSVSNENYYARVKMGGKRIRRCLETTVWATAKLRLVDFLKEQQTQPTASPSISFTEAVALYDAHLENDTGIKHSSRKYRRWCIKKIQSSRLELLGMSLPGLGHTVEAGTGRAVFQQHHRHAPP